MKMFSNTKTYLETGLIVFAVLVVSQVPADGFGQQLSLVDGNGEGKPPIYFSTDIVIGGNGENSIVIGGVSSVAVNSKGHIFVSETRIPCVYKFDSDGLLLAQFGQEGDGPGDLSFATRLAIDSSDRIFVAGRTGQVHVMDSEWNYIEGFKREHVGETVRSIQVASDGTIAIAVLGIKDNTTVDLYTADFVYQKSFAKTFADEDEDWRYESLYAGGYICEDSDGSFLFAQLSPYGIKRFASDGELLMQTDEGGSDFIQAPPRPDFDGERVSVRFLWGTTGIVSLSNGNILTSSWKTFDDGSKQSLFCLYNSNLELIGRSVYEDFQAVEGIDNEGRIFLYSKDVDSKRIVRAQVRCDG